jgi:hypothetical protein
LAIRVLGDHGVYVAPMTYGYANSYVRGHAMVSALRHGSVCRIRLDTNTGRFEKVDSADVP